MSDKLKHVNGEYQLDRKHMGVDAGMVGNALVDKVFGALNDLDLNHDQKSDVAEVAPYIIKAMPFIIQLAPLIEPDGVKAWLISHKDFFKDAVEAAKQIEAAAAVAAEAAIKLAPKP